MPALDKFMMDGKSKRLSIRTKMTEKQKSIVASAKLGTIFLSKSKTMDRNKFICMIYFF